MSHPHLGNHRNHYAQSICLFLSELLRTRKISLVRAAEISKKFLQNVNLLDTEEQFLKLVKELTGEFEELITLERRIFLHMKVGDREQLENRVSQFVIKTLSADMHLASEILQEAIKEECTEEDLIKRFPQFREFIGKNHATH